MKVLWQGETGNYYYGARYYDPKISVWLSVDPLATKYPEWTPYNFTMNNPVNLIDPNGDSVKTSQEGYDHINSGLNATLGEGHPFGYDPEKGVMTFDLDAFAESGDKYDSDQIEIIERVALAVISKNDNITVNVVDRKDNITINGKSTSLNRRGDNGLTILAAGTSYNTVTGEAASTDQTIYLRRTSIGKHGNKMPVLNGVTALHELGGHVYENMMNLNQSDAQRNVNTEVFENMFRRFYKIGGGNFLGGSAVPHKN